jgi:hypothetical protein
VLHLNFAREAAGAAGIRHSLRPLFYGAKRFLQKLGRLAPRDRERAPEIVWLFEN